MSDKMTWPESTVAKVHPFSGKTFIGDVEVVFDPIERVYSPVEKKRYRKVGYREYDLREK